MTTTISNKTLSTSSSRRVVAQQQQQGRGLDDDGAAAAASAYVNIDDGGDATVTTSQKATGPFQRIDSSHDCNNGVTIDPIDGVLQQAYQSPHVLFHHLRADQPVTSTQEEAKRLLLETYYQQHEERQGRRRRQQQVNDNDNDESDTVPQQQQSADGDTKNTAATNWPNLCLAVVADRQTGGRGTQGRKWESTRPIDLKQQQQQQQHQQQLSNTIPTVNGDDSENTNLFLTVAVPLDRIPIRFTLLPLQLGVWVAQGIAQLLKRCRIDHDPIPATSDADVKVTVKWPNDVLVNQEKIAGILIENIVIPNDDTKDDRSNDSWWFLIGIGVNVAYAPDLHSSPGKQVRPATCVAKHCHNPLPPGAAVALGLEFANVIADWIFNHDGDNNKKPTSKIAHERQIVDEWRSWAELGQVYELRGATVKQEHDKDSTGQPSYQGERVVTIDIQDDGQLRVRGEDGRERLLIADYMF